MVSSSPLWGTCIGQWSGCTDRTVKYMANRPAKNISSLESHTIVPTLTTFGRVSECTLLDSKLGAAAVEVTHALWPGQYVLLRSGWGCCGGRTKGRSVGFRAPIRSAA